MGIAHRLSLFLLCVVCRFVVCGQTIIHFTQEPAVPVPVGTAQIVFTDAFAGRLEPGWHWLREHPGFWRLVPSASGNGLEVRIEPGNMWGPQNDARNVLWRPAPDLSSNTVQILVTFRNAPTHQYEQSDLVWYLDDSNMVKLGQELVDGKLSVVMGREEKDVTRTISITPLSSQSVRLRLAVSRKEIRGAFTLDEGRTWREVGACEPARTEAPGVLPKISLQFYQGAVDLEHWSRATHFEIRRLTQ